MHKKEKNQYMNFWMLVALVSGNMVGSGIFLLPSELAKFGSISILAWIFTTIGSLFLALVFCSFSRLIPKVDGGPYIYVRVGMGKFLGFQSGFGYWVSLWVGNCAIALAMVGYLSFFFPILSNNIVTVTAAIGIIWFITIFNMFGVRTLGWLQLISMVGKTLPLLFIIFLGIWYIHPEYYLDFNHTGDSNLNALSAAASLTLWAFVGLESAAVTASKVKDPEKTIPLATLTGTIIAGFIYISSSIVIMGMLPSNDLVESSAPFALAAQKIIGPSGGTLVAIAAVIACFGTLNGWIMLTAVVSKSIAETKLFPKIFTKQNRFGGLSFGLLFPAILMTALLLLTTSKALVEQFELIILMSVFTALVPYFYTSIANILVIKQKDTNYKIWQTGVVIAIFACIYSFWTIWGLGQEVVYYGTILFFLGTPIYVISGWMVSCKK